ncbi:DUF1761 domain-containing protein [Rhizobium sp. CC-YZS058]|uniref:DUF1761 domain-containing protein n=1 Tax=Rhizobium sp. CC-YZS058 TaxID=3042153 RepID=UPI002B05F07D|nr:DUF1761 domain-containing protein [Rhizobium sp. CC-YZS058]MEA3536998.1 DUF1761 domain-containing protein [Rhizobium sp. CC-YZS058]
MNTVLDHVSIPAVFVAAVAVMVLGFLWFAVAFKRRYAVVLGRVGQPDAMGPLFIVGPSICVFVTAFTIAYLMSAQRVASLREALGFGAVVGLGFLAATSMNMAINPNIPRPIAYGLLSSAYFFVSSVLISAVVYLVS